MKCKSFISALTAAAMAVGLILPVSSARAEDIQLRVMPLGDSITDGFTVTGGYRVPLWHLLDDAGLAEGIDFVGPNWGSDGVADPNHAGYSGYSIADIPNQRSGIYNFIDWLMEEYPADVVMLQIGTNDILSSYELDTAGERLELLVDSILTYIPEGGVLYVSTIPYMDADVTTYTDAYTAEEMDAAVDAYNADVREVVSKKAAEGKPIVQADINSVLTKADLSDGVHPSEDGYRKMAEYWNGVLNEYISGVKPAPTEPDTTETQPTEQETDAPTEPDTSEETDTSETEPTMEPETSEPETSEPTEPDTDPVTPMLMGDVNCDGEIAVTDIVYLQKYLLGMETLNVQAYENADLHADGVVDVFDLGMLKRMVFTLGQIPAPLPEL